MTSNTSNERVRTRAQRVASKVAYEGVRTRVGRIFYEDHGLIKLALVFVTSLLICVLCNSWDPPFKYRKFLIPDRDVVCKTNFETKSNVTNSEKQRVRAQTPRYYINEPLVLIEYKNLIVHKMMQLISVPDYASCSKDDLEFLNDFLPPDAAEDAAPVAFQKFQTYLAEDVGLDHFSRGLENALLPFEKKGVLRVLPSSREKEAEPFAVEKTVLDGNKVSDGVIEKIMANQSDSTAEQSSSEQPSAASSNSEQPSAASTSSEQPSAVNDAASEAVASENDEVKSESSDYVDGALEKIRIYYSWETPNEARDEEISAVMLGAAPRLSLYLKENFNDPEIVSLLARMIKKTIPESLTKDYQATRKAQDEAEDKIDNVTVKYQSGDPLIRANATIDVDALNLLKAEYLAHINNRTFMERAGRFCAVFALIFFLMFGTYFLFLNKLVAPTTLLRQRHSIAECAGFFLAMILFFAAARLLQIASEDSATNPEIMPLLIFVQLTAIAGTWEVAVTYGAILAFALTVATTGDVNSFLVFIGSGSVAALASRNVRARVELFMVALTSGALAFLLCLASNFVIGGSTRVLEESAFCGLWAFLAGFITSGILPLFERTLGILTPMRLLEYSNPSHPLLLELNRRAPATYSHAIQTAALAEPAAEAIGARSALVRVGAYFHDVGKMLQPEHFTENQKGYNIHDDLEPRISALVIVAHVKDGADLARRYQLPRQIVDLLEQHHGTMRVGQFYDRAMKAVLEQNPDAQPLDEAPFRYPGPVPLSKEAGVLMLADATESASRSLTDWSPRRLENLVHKIVDQRIEDGQFNESGLTLGEIHAIEQSLVTTLLASHHTRVKYDEKPDAKEIAAAKELARA